MERKAMGVTEMEGGKAITDSCLPTGLLPETGPASPLLVHGPWVGLTLPPAPWSWA